MSEKSDANSQALAAAELLREALPGRVITTENATEHKVETSRSWQVILLFTTLRTGHVLTPFTLSRSSTCWTPAAAYVQPTTTEEVARVLAIVKQTGTKFAIRATGHNPNPGFSNIDGTGIVIDLGSLKSLSLTDQGILQAGAGNTWGEVYAWLEERQLSATGGREPAVGVGGFLLGGGLGPFPNLHGVGADGVTNFEVSAHVSQISGRS